MKGGIEREEESREGEQNGNHLTVEGKKNKKGREKKREETQLADYTERREKGRIEQINIGERKWEEGREGK